LEKMDDLSDLEIKKEVIYADSDKADLEGKSEAYVSARFDMIAERLGEKLNKESAIGKGIVDSREDGTVSVSEKARKKMIEDGLNAWKNKQETKGA
jgi:hypothetical protein